MIIKQYLPFLFSREGYIPDRIVLKFCDNSEESCRKDLETRKKTAHYYLASDGCITALTPLSAAANLLGSVGETGEKSQEIPQGRRGILILMEGDGKLSEEQKTPLIRLLKTVQKEVLRIYGQNFDFCRETLLTDPNVTLPLEEILDEGLYRGRERSLFRVQTGSYRHRKDEEDSIERLQRAGIAAYITEVRE